MWRVYVDLRGRGEGKGKGGRGGMEIGKCGGARWEFRERRGRRRVAGRHGKERGRRGRGKRENGWEREKGEWKVWERWLSSVGSCEKKEGKEVEDSDVQPAMGKGVDG